jgi:Ice-binding-like
MKNSSVHAMNRSVVLMLAAIVAGCSATDNGANVRSSSLEDPAFSTFGGKALGPHAVNLGGAGDFVILSKTGISTVPQSAITGNIGVSPIARGGMTGFSETMDGTNTFSQATQVTGKMFAADYSGTTPSVLGLAVLDMQAAYTDAAGRPADFNELASGNIGGLTIEPGTYKWGTGVSILSDVTIHGGPNDVFIFQIAGGITQANATRVTLTGGARPQNIFWQVADVVAIGTTAHMEGIILAQTAITVATGASVNGRLLAQTAVTLQMNAITQP